MNTRTITAVLVSLSLVVMALAPNMIDEETMNEVVTSGFVHDDGNLTGTNSFNGTLTWEGGDWNASWVCDGGLALVTPSDWADFVASGEGDPHNWTSWGINLTGAGDYTATGAPDGDWVVTAGLGCMDDAGDMRAAGGQYGDDHVNPTVITIGGGSDTSDVSFTLIEHGGLMEHIGIVDVYDVEWDDEVYFQWTAYDLAPEANYTVEHLIYTGPNSSISMLNYTLIGSDGEEQTHTDHFVITDYGLPTDGCYMFVVMLYDADDGHLFHGDSKGFSMGEADCEGEEGDGPDAQEVMDMCDMDGDGECTWDEFKSGFEAMAPELVDTFSEDQEDELETMYNYYDGNSSGGLDLAEMADFLDDLNDWIDENCDDEGCDGGGLPSPEDFVDWFDTDGDGVLTLAEIIDGINDSNDAAGEPHLSAEDEDMIEDIFTIADDNEDGVLDLDELGGFIFMLDGDDEEEPGMEEIFSWIDTNGDGHITWDEMVDFFDSMGEETSAEELAMIQGIFNMCAEPDTDLDITQFACFMMMMDELEDDGPSFVCGDGDEIPFDFVNDGEEDCDDGSDEPQDFDGDGVTDNWFDCHDGSNTSMDNVNDGNWDCPDGEDEGEGYDMGEGEGGPDCAPNMEINFQQNADDTATLTFTQTCVHDANGTAEMMYWLDTDGDGTLSAAEITAAQDEMANCTYEDENGTEIPCDEYEDDGVFSYDGVAMEIQPLMATPDIIALNSDGYLVMSGVETVTVPSDSSLYSHTLSYDSNEGDGGNDECMGGVDITAADPWSVSNVSFLPVTDWVPGMYADGSGWYVDNVDTDGDGDCNSEPITASMVFTTPEPVDTEPVCNLHYYVAFANSTEPPASGNEIVTGPDGDGNLTLEPGFYYVGVTCSDAEGDEITTDWSTADGTLSNSAVGNGSVFGWVQFTILENVIAGSIVVDYSWSSTTFGGNGTVTFDFAGGDATSDSSDGDIAEGSGGGIPGFTSVLTVTALLGAVLYLGRRD